MPTKRSSLSKVEVFRTTGGNGRKHIQTVPGANAETATLRNIMSAKSKTTGNQYRCALERNQNGKYNIRVRAIFGADRDAGDSDGSSSDHSHLSGWTLPVYFLASSFNAAMKKLEESLQLLQKSEARLRFWGMERTDDPKLAGELLKELGLWLDRRREFPRKVAELDVARERPISASALAPVRRVLADSVAQERPAGQVLAAGD